MLSFSNFRKKKSGYYKGILENADPGLHAKVMSVLNNSVVKNSAILDLGSGEGAMSQRLFDAGYNVIALDIDKEHFKAVGPEFHQINFNDADQVIKFAEKYKDYFDAVVGMEVIEHLENPWAYIRLLKKMVKQGGKIIVTTPNTASWLSRFYFLFTGEFCSFNDQTADEYGHVSPISPWELGLIFKREGLTNIRMYKGGHLPSLWITLNYLIVISVMLSPFFRPFMKGFSRGWCVIAVGERKIKNK
jgi:SAM-dependent methyltransferase